MEMSEFLNREPEEVPAAEELDVQKAVVESLAADKAEQDERIATLRKENATLVAQISNLKSQNEDLKSQIEEMKKALAKVGDVLAANSEGETSSKIALLDRNPEIDDRFPGETRDHVLEVIKAAREAAEKDGRVRLAQVLESVLVVNTPLGKLVEKRNALRKLFTENGNILSGPVIAELQKQGIPHKNGEDYLLPEEILKRTY